MSNSERNQLLQVVCLQIASALNEDKGARLDRVLAQIDLAAPAADLLVLPELWATGYFAFERYAEDAEGLDGPLMSAMSEAAKRHGVHLAAGSFVERDDDNLYNTAVLFGPEGTVLQTYRKVHLFAYGSKESDLMTAGDSIHVADTAFGKVGTTTCYDIRFPELYRLMTAQGLEVLVVPAAWPYARLSHWRTLLQARAIENQLVVIACNGAGTQGSVRLAANSMVIGPWGDVIAEAGDEEANLLATVDVGEIARVRQEFPVLTHRRMASGVMGPHLGVVARKTGLRG